MNVYVITAVHIENNELSRIKGYISSVNFSLFFPPSQFPVELSRDEIIGLIRQGSIFNTRAEDGKNIPLLLNQSKNTVSLQINQFENIEKY